MPCPRCTADPQPKHFGNPRQCAFDDAGVFTDANWNCATLEALLALDRVTNHDGNDESLQMLYANPTDTFGWLILTRYKYRGKTSSAVMLGDHAPLVLTLAVAESILSGKWPDLVGDDGANVVTPEPDGPGIDQAVPQTISAELLAVLPTNNVH